MSITACVEVCVDEVCHTIGCSSNEIRQSNDTVFNGVNETVLNATQLPCMERIIFHIDEVPFTISIIIIFILSLLFTIYAIKKKWFSRNGVLQNSSP